MSLVGTAYALAADAHRRQLDKAGRPYREHPARLAAQCEPDEAKAVALLHDVLEDSDLTAADLANSGIPESVIAALECLTHTDAESYETYIGRVGRNPLARKIKLLDLKDNMDLTRITHRALGDKDWARLAKYHRSYRFLTEIDRGERSL